MNGLAPLALWVASLFDQAVVRILQRDFPQAQFVLVDVGSKSVLGSRWRATEPVPVGSLMKPFVALAIGSDPGHARCNPRDCWLRSGHGDIGLVRAIAESCNSYFLQKAPRVSRDRIVSIAARFGIPSPRNFEARTIIGIGDGWSVSPEQMALAFAVLAEAPDGRTIREGLRLCGRSGTARLLRGMASAKTGTAPCRHGQRAPGDGYVAVLYPSETPRYMLLVQVHGVSGAEATRTAAAMLAVVRDGK